MGRRKVLVSPIVLESLLSRGWPVFDGEARLLLENPLPADAWLRSIDWNSDRQDTITLEFEAESWEGTEGWYLPRFTKVAP